MPINLPKIDLSNLDPSQIDWSQFDLRNVDFSTLDVGMINWEQLDPTKIKWEEIDASKIDWKRADPSKIDWSRIDPSRINWEQVDPSRVSWEQVDPSKVVNYVGRRIEALRRTTESIVVAIVAAMNRLLLQAFDALVLDRFVEPPSIIRTGEAFPGEPVYYVNGMSTTRSEALEEARALADQLMRPVYLIYNATEGLPLDLQQCAYDFMWPGDMLGLMSIYTIVGQLKSLFAGRLSFQLNETTRQVSHLLYHADRPISIVSHSQGCMIVRNACFTLFLFGKEGWVRSKLAWVAAGTPLNDNLVWPTASKFESVRTDSDFVAKLVALSGNLADWSQWLEDHKFIKRYVSLISNSMLWPAGDQQGSPGGQLPPPAADVSGTVTASKLNVRQAPGTTASVLGSLASGAEVLVIGRNADGTWLLIRRTGSGPSMGWASAQFIQLTIPVQQLPIVAPGAPGPAPASDPTPALLQGSIALPVFDPIRQTYDIYRVDVAKGTLTKVVTEASQPALSPDGRRLAFRHWKKDNRGLVVTDASGSNPIRVSIFFEDVLPSWAADGKQIVFSSYRESDRKSRLYHLFADRQADSTLKRGSDVIFGEAPYWLRDGRVVYRVTFPSKGFLLMNFDGSNASTLLLDESALAPAVSDDNAAVVFMSKRSGTWDIWRIGLNGRNLQQLTLNAGNNGLPVWAPDGRMIAFVSDRDGAWGLWAMNPDGANLRRIVALPGPVDGRVGDEPDYLNHGWFEEQIAWSR